MIDRKQVLSQIGDDLRQGGFLQRRGTWHLVSPEVTVVFDLQKSSFANRYWANIGFWIESLGHAQRPRVHQCHLYFRVERLFPEYRETILMGLSFEEESVAQCEEFLAFVRDIFVPFCQAATRMEYMRKLYHWGKLRDGLVKKEAQDVLGGARDALRVVHCAEGRSGSV